MGKGDEFNCEISFTNPLEEPLTECAVEYESSGVPRCDSQQQPKYVEINVMIQKTNKYAQEMLQRSRTILWHRKEETQNADTKTRIFISWFMGKQFQI